MTLSSLHTFVDLRKLHMEQPCRTPGRSRSPDVFADSLFSAQPPTIFFTCVVAILLRIERKGSLW
jgi:hypothetical protein